MDSQNRQNIWQILFTSIKELCFIKLSFYKIDLNAKLGIYEELPVAMDWQEKYAKTHKRSIHKEKLILNILI
jgi:hypothetical protein